MPLRSSNLRHDVFFEVPAILLDTCAITWVAKKPDGIELFDKLIENYRVLIPTPVLYELAFGPIELAHANERLIRERLSDYRQQANHHGYEIARRNKQIRPGGYYIINPSYLEWWSARDRLLRYIELAGASANKSKREHSLDALIHSCARNIFSPICTINLRDFERMNRAGAAAVHDGTVPVFSPEQVLQAITEDVCFDDRI